MNEVAAIEPGPEHAVPVPVGMLSDAAAARIARSVPAETQRAYRGDLARFVDWCAEESDAANTTVEALPATADSLASYLTWMADTGRAPATIERGLAAIIRAHKAAGLAQPDTQAARAVIRTAQRDAAEAGRGVDKATAVTVAALRALVAVCDPQTLIGRRDRAVLVLGFATAARRSELARLDVADVAECDEGITVTVRVTKTGVGREVAVPYGSRSDTCPVRAVRGWTEIAGITEGPLFRRVDSHGTLGRSPNGRGTSDGRLTGQAIALIVARAAQRAGLAGGWSGHSLRRGFATEARRAGHDLVAIGRHGGWKDGSRALLGYFEEVDRWTENPLIGIAL
jgi:site-specific recombinase XerD